MNRVDAKRRVGALAFAIGITCSIVWALSTYAYRAPSSDGFPETASTVAKARGCS